MWIAWVIGCTGGTVSISDTDRVVGPTFDTHDVGPALTVQPRNLLMISIDTLRRDHVDRYATDGIERMPFLTGLFDEAVVLDDHQQCSNWTFASTFCTVTGVELTDGEIFPRMTGAGQQIPEGQQTLARMLGSAGFQTALASTNIYFSEETGGGQGYDRYSLSRGQDATVALQQGQLHLEAMVASDAPWFLHVHLYDPHHPYLPPAQYLDPLGEPWDLPYDLSTSIGQNAALSQISTLDPDDLAHLKAWMRGGYNGEARFVDAKLAEIWPVLDAAGYLDDTLVVFWTDHGEQFWEHELYGHAKLLVAEENDAILAFWAKGQAPVAWQGPTHSVDMVPTILDALGVAAPPGLSGEVVGLAPPDRARFTATSAYAGQHQAVTVEGWKLHYSWGGEYRLWDRSVDPTESNDLYLQEPERADALWQALQPQLQRMQILIPEASPTL